MIFGRTPIFRTGFASRQANFHSTGRLSLKPTLEKPITLAANKPWMRHPAVMVTMAALGAGTVVKGLSYMAESSLDSDHKARQMKKSTKE